MARKLFILFLLSVCGISIFLGAWYVINGDISFYTDIARDFLLMKEVAEKKFILVGPRADWKGLFHGPLWIYVNYPAYALGSGNPLAIGWWWILLTASFSTAYFFLFKKLFKSTIIPLTFVTLFLLALINEEHTYYNPTGAMFVIPFYFYTAIMYFQTHKRNYLFIHMFLAGLLVQFQLAVGIPMVMLSSVGASYLIWKNKKYNHLLSFIFLLIPLLSFILFNLKHNFSYVHGIIEHFSDKTTHETLPLMEKINNRIQVMTTATLWFFRGNFAGLNILMSFLITVIITKVILLKDKKYWNVYVLFIFFYVGFFVLSLVHSGWVLTHYFLPFISLPLLIFSTSYNQINKKLFYFIVIGVVILNFLSNMSLFSDAKNFIGKKQTSWKFLLSVAETPFNSSAEKDFGVYIYAPDVYAYAPKYAITYAQRIHPEKNMHYNKKYKETYLIIEPPPSDRPELDGSYWKTSQIKIKSEPVKVIHLENGYRIEKYILSGDDLTTPSDTSIDDWISQR